MNNDHAQIKQLEYDYIADGIYIGTNQCCQTHFDGKLKAEGITADISLEENRLDAPFGVEVYIWIPVKNHMPPAPDQLEFGVSVLQKLVGMKKKVYVHCENGHGRAPTLVAAYLLSTGKTPEEVEVFIKTRRPSVHLEEVQREALQSFSRRRLKSKKTLYQCAECGFHYEDKKQAERCEAWCKKHKSCNIEIIASAIENKKS